MKFFNTAGPVNRPDHYKLDPLARWNLEEVLGLIKQEKYFVLHAPRQTGKTSSLLALRDYLNAGDDYVCVYANIEAAQVARHRVEAGIGAILGELSRRVRALQDLGDQTRFFAEPADAASMASQLSACFSTEVPEQALNTALEILCRGLRRPLVLLLDEVDALVGDTLVSVLRQLRGGYDKRPEAAPSTVVLCGVRDIKDYRIHQSNQEIITGGSAFNIKAESLRLGNFSRQDIEQLYLEHTKETGQLFKPACFDLAWDYTHGQPWLVNALAYELTWKMQANRDPRVTLTPAMMEEAKEALILSRATHLDQLADKLDEERVRRVILPIILGESDRAGKDDEQYCIDLGLVRPSPEGLVISNAIYQEIIPRELTESRQREFQARFQPEWVRPDGSLDTPRLLTMFQDFWRENAEIWGSHIRGYQGAAPQLVTQAFLQRVANGNGLIIREYALLRRRTDLMLKWRYGEGPARMEQKVVIEIKTIRSRDGYERVKAEGVAQTADYARLCGTTEAHLLIFDRDGNRGWKAILSDDPDGLEVGKAGRSGQRPVPQPLPDPGVPFRDKGEHEGLAVEIWGF